VAVGDREFFCREVIFHFEISSVTADIEVGKPRTLTSNISLFYDLRILFIKVHWLCIVHTIFIGIIFNQSAKGVQSGGN